MRALGASILAILLAAALSTSCQVASAEGPDLRRLPPCQAGDEARVKPGMGKARVRWIHQRDDGFRARGARLSIDGRSVYESHDMTELQREVLLLADLDLAAGEHRLDGVVTMSGWGEGPFAHLADYRAERPVHLAFSIEPAEQQCISLLIYYRDGLTLPIEQRPVARLVAQRN